MESNGKTFASLVSDSPLFQKPTTITLTGALARTADEGKFALVQADGSALTLDSAAVHSHAVIGNSLGQSIVQVEMDAEKAPREALEQSQAITPTGIWWSGFWWDHGRVVSTPEPLPPSAQSVSPLSGYFSGWPRGWDSAPRPAPKTSPLTKPRTSYLMDGYKNSFIGVDAVEAPFSLATPHQICSDLLAYMEAMNPASQG